MRYTFLLLSLFFAACGKNPLDQPNSPSPTKSPWKVDEPQISENTDSTSSTPSTFAPLSLLSIDTDSELSTQQILKFNEDTSKLQINLEILTLCYDQNLKSTYKFQISNHPIKPEYKVGLLLPKEVFVRTKPTEAKISCGFQFIATHPQGHQHKFSIPQRPINLDDLKPQISIKLTSNLENPLTDVTLSPTNDYVAEIDQWNSDLQLELHCSNSIVPYQGVMQKFVNLFQFNLMQIKDTLKKPAPYDTCRLLLSNSNGSVVSLSDFFRLTFSQPKIESQLIPQKTYQNSTQSWPAKILVLEIKNAEPYSIHLNLSELPKTAQRWLIDWKPRKTHSEEKISYHIFSSPSTPIASTDTEFTLSPMGSLTIEFFVPSPNCHTKNIHTPEGFFDIGMFNTISNFTINVYENKEKQLLLSSLEFAPQENLIRSILFLENPFYKYLPKELDRFIDDESPNCEFTQL